MCILLGIQDDAETHRLATVSPSKFFQVFFFINTKIPYTIYDITVFYKSYSSVLGKLCRYALL